MQNKQIIFVIQRKIFNESFLNDSTNRYFPFETKRLHSKIAKKELRNLFSSGASIDYRLSAPVPYESYEDFLVYRAGEKELL